MNRRELMLAMMATAPLAACASVSAQTDSSADTSGVGAILDAEMAKGTIAGLSLCVLKGDTVIASETRGMANLAFDVPVTPETLFHVGSVGKHCTATAILRLAEEGKLSLDAPISTYLTDISPAWGAATPRLILHHVSGLPDYFQGYGFTAFDRPLTREGMVELTMEIPPIAPPGEAFFYSNAAYTLLGYVIEEVSGQSYADYMRSIFGAFGMPNARADDGQAVIPNRADSYEWTGTEFRRSVQMASTTSAVAAGGLLMSGVDVPEWERALNGNAMLSQASKAEMFTPWIYPSGRSTAYCCGWREDTLDGEDIFYHHTGWVPDFPTYHLRQPSSDISLMLMTTGLTDVLSLGLRVAESITPGSTSFSLSPVADEHPDMTESMLAAFTRADAIDPALLAPEMSVLPEIVQDYFVPRLEGAPNAFEVVQDTKTGADHYRRYRVTENGEVSHYMANYDGEGRISFVRKS